MKMNITITESQKRRILTESISENISSIIEKGYELVKDVLKKSSEQMGINFEFAVTWGASIGGMVGPLNDFIKNTQPEINDVEVSLLLTGIIATYYFDNKEYLEKILNKIKEKGLGNVFKSVFKKSKELKDAFLDFINSLNVTFHKITNIMSYTFIIPIIPLLYDMAKEGSVQSGEISEITKRIVSFGLVTVSGLLLKELMTKVINRFRS